VSQASAGDHAIFVGVTFDSPAPTDDKQQKVTNTPIANDTWPLSISDIVSLAWAVVKASA